MKENIKKLYEVMLEEVALYTEMGTSPAKRYSGKIKVIHKALENLKQYIQHYPFADQQEEINFFKYEKPSFVCELLYARQLFSIETQRREFNEEILIRNYFEQELKLIKRNLLQHQFLYQYFTLEASELDALLFIRGAVVQGIILPVTPDLDADYSTKGDYLFSQFMAFEKLQQYLINELYPSADQRRTASTISWTGESVNLVELAYGLQFTGQFNEGRATITEIIQALEKFFNIEVGNAYRRWHAISNRKRVTPTKFIDQMRTAINKRLDDDSDLNKGK